MKRRRNARAVLRAIHRDLGYLCIGLTIVYAISGVAVNHIHEWNPNYAVSLQRFELGPIPHAVPAGDDTTLDVLRRLGMDERFDTTFQSDPASLRIVQGPITIDVDLTSGRGMREDVRTRPILYESNVLHLNHQKGVWTWVADGFAVSLAFLALSGAFILRGRQGLTGRGLWFTLTGLAIPIVFLLV
jgi:hypothetical protein